MFEAYSDKQGKIVDISQAWDIKELYHCPNPHCSALFRIRCATGDRAKHFCRSKETPHSPGCTYEFGSKEYIDSGAFIKSDLETIFSRGTPKGGHSFGAKRVSTFSDVSSRTQYISTPRQLLTYCVSNQLSTEYLPGIKVDDIILDNRNLACKRRYEGITGLRLLVAKYDKPFGPDMIQLRLTASRKYRGDVFIKAWIRMPTEHFLEIKKHIDDTYVKKGISNPTIAVLGKWKIEDKYLISCYSEDLKHIILL